MDHTQNLEIEEDYRRAESFLPWNIDKLLRNAAVIPNWIERGHCFWYRRDTQDGKEFVLVDPAQHQAVPAFDHQRLAEALSQVSRTTCLPGNLPFDTFGFVDGRKAICFDAMGTGWWCELETYLCVRTKEQFKPSAHELPSPDGRWIAFVRAHNLWMRSTDTGEEIPLTTDGAPHYAYATPSESRLSTVADLRSGREPEIIGLWSPTSKQFLTQHLDERSVGQLHLLEMAGAKPGARPGLYAYRYPFPGDSAVPLAHLVIIDPEQQKTVRVQSEPLLASPFSPLQEQRVWWSDDGSQLFFIAPERGFKTLHLRQADATTGVIRTILSELDTHYIDLNVDRFERPNVRVLENSQEIVWFAERDGWAHLYLHDSATGKLKNRITQGEYVVRDIAYVDEQNRHLYFTANGREPASDPYFRHLYRVNLDGSELKLLTSEDADHWIRAAPDGQRYVDTYCWGIASAPVSVLRDANGKVLRTLEALESEPLRAKGWTFPERFKVKARDGQTDVYGVLFRPSNFDPARRYPVIDDIYPGPQVIRCPLSRPMDAFRALLWHPQAVAELGFIVVQLDGMGTSLRSRAFREVSYGHLEEAGGLADHVSGLQQLAARYPYIDLSRVGIYGHSGGGYASVQAILTYPDFYKVAVASAGNHEVREYILIWGESYQGYPLAEHEASQTTLDLVKNLQGKLLLAHGDLDDNVHPAQTIQLVDALIKANKDFDLLLLPGRHHSLVSQADTYFLRRRWDYFVRHLAGVEPPKEFTFQRATVA